MRATLRRSRGASWSASRRSCRRSAGASTPSSPRPQMPTELAVLNGARVTPRRRIPVGIVDRVLPESPAEQAGVMAGDSLLAVNSLVPRDIIDARLDAATSSVELDLERDGQRLVVTLTKDPDEDLG